MYPNPEFSDFLRNVQKEYPNYRFVGQIRNELRLLYTGCPFPAGEAYPCKEPESPAYSSGKARYFINVPSWLSYMREMDLSIGTRFHGKMTGTLVGTPSILLASDARTRELADYHKLPSVPMHELKMGMSLPEIVERVDFKEMETVHERNFKHYLSFLEENGLEHIYRYDQKINYLEKKMEGVTLNPGVKPWMGILEEEYKYRVGLSYDWLTSEYYKNKYGILS